MGTFAAMLAPDFDFCEGCDGNKPIDRFVIPESGCRRVSSPFAARFFCSKKSFYIVYLYLHLVSEFSFFKDWIILKSSSP